MTQQESELQEKIADIFFNKYNALHDNIFESEFEAADAAASETLSFITDYHKRDKNRYCGVCYKPCIEQGGWYCPKHKYQSIYITQQEAKELRQELHKRDVAEARIDELSGVRGWSAFEADPTYYRQGRFHVVPYSYLSDRIKHLKSTQDIEASND